MLRSNKPKPPLFGTQVNTSRDNINILDEIGEEVHEEDEFARAMEFVCLYELRKHEIGLHSIIRTNEKHPVDGAAGGKKKVRGKVERPKESADRQMDKPNQPSHDTSFRSQQRKFNARPARTGGEQIWSKPLNEGSFGFAPSSSDQSRIRPCYSVSDFMKDQPDQRPTMPSSRFDVPLLQSSTIQFDIPKWSDFQVEHRTEERMQPSYKEPSFRTHNQFRTEVTNTSSWQSPPLQRVGDYESPSFIKPVNVSSVHFGNPTTTAASRKFEFRQQAYDTSPSRGQQVDHYEPPRVRKQLHYEDDHYPYDEQQTRSLFESPSRPFIIPATNKRVKQAMTHAKSQHDISPQHHHCDVPDPRLGKPIAVLSVQHQFHVDRNGVRTSQQPMKHSESHYLYKQPEHQQQEMHQQSDPEDEIPPKPNKSLQSDGHQKPQKLNKPQSRKMQRASGKSPRTPTKKEALKQDTPFKKVAGKEAATAKVPSKQPYFADIFNDRLKSLIDSNTVSKIHVDVHTPPRSPKLPRQQDNNGYQSNDEDLDDAALNQSLENLSRGMQPQQWRDTNQNED